MFSTTSVIIRISTRKEIPQPRFWNDCNRGKENRPATRKCRTAMGGDSVSHETCPFLVRAIPGITSPHHLTQLNHLNLLRTLRPALVVQFFRFLRGKTINDNKHLVQRWFEEVWNQGREATIDELLSPQGVGFGLAATDSEVDGPSELK